MRLQDDAAKPHRLGLRQPLSLGFPLGLVGGKLQVYMAVKIDRPNEKFVIKPHGSSASEQDASLGAPGNAVKLVDTSPPNIYFSAS